MERRSRSQTRRTDGGVAGGAPGQNNNRHASSSRLPETGHAQLSYPRPPEQARTLSPDRRDRYRASGRGGYPDQGPTSLPPPRPDQYPPQTSSVPHSNSNSYNQYNSQYPINTGGYGELPPPRPNPPATMSYNNNTAPPRPDPPSGYQQTSTSNSQLQNPVSAQSPSKNTNVPPENKTVPPSNGSQVMLKNSSNFLMCLARVCTPYWPSTWGPLPMTIRCSLNPSSYASLMGTKFDGNIGFRHRTRHYFVKGSIHFIFTYNNAQEFI